MAKSEICAIHVWQPIKNLVCQRAGRRENDFASSITSHEISYVTETHEYPGTGMGLPRERRVVCEGYAAKRVAARSDVLR
jgi:hypothetical protein